VQTQPDPRARLRLCVLVLALFAKRSWDVVAAAEEVGSGSDAHGSTSSAGSLAAFHELLLSA
jgi:hypothetical protein